MTEYLVHSTEGVETLGWLQRLSDVVTVAVTGSYVGRTSFRGLHELRKTSANRLGKYIYVCVKLCDTDDGQTLPQE